MKQKIAYIISRFPRITETFILYEILELQRLGLRVEIFPLVYEKAGARHPEVSQLMPQVHPAALGSPRLWAAQLYWLLTHPAAYLGSWAAAIRGNWRSPKFLGRALAVVPMAAAFARQIKRLGIEHVHAHWATHPALAAYVVKQLTGVPYSFTTHAHDIFVERPMLAEKIQAADFVVTISDYNQRFLQDLYGKTAADKVQVVRCGIAPDTFRPMPRSENNQFTLVTTASLEEKKGHPYLIEAYARLKEQIDFRALFIGDGDDRLQIEALIRQHGLESHIQLMGRQPQDRVVELVGSADVMVLPSITTSRGKKEGIPVSLMEAMAMELPVIATDISGIPELVRDGETGLLVPEKDAAALSDALLRLHKSPDLRRRLGQAGRLLVNTEFNLHHNSARLFALLTTNQDAAPAAPAHASSTKENLAS